jgi:hypothetical protein
VERLNDTLPACKKAETSTGTFEQAYLEHLAEDAAVSCYLLFIPKKCLDFGLT